MLWSLTELQSTLRGRRRAASPRSWCAAAASTLRRGGMRWRYGRWTASLRRRERVRLGGRTGRMPGGPVPTACAALALGGTTVRKDGGVNWEAERQPGGDCPPKGLLPAKGAAPHYTTRSTWTSNTEWGRTNRQPMQNGTKTLPPLQRTAPRRYNVCAAARTWTQRNERQWGTGQMGATQGAVGVDWSGDSEGKRIARLVNYATHHLPPPSLSITTPPQQRGSTIASTTPTQAPAASGRPSLRL